MTECQQNVSSVGFLQYDALESEHQYVGFLTSITHQLLTSMAKNIPLSYISPTNVTPANTTPANAPPPPPSRAPYPDYDDEEAASAPWKYAGYRVFSKWVASEQAFFIVRRFGALNTRVILALQDEIVQLEQTLNALDESFSRKEKDTSTNNGSFRYDPSVQRRELVQEILPGKLLRYSMSLLQGDTR